MIPSASHSTSSMEDIVGDTSYFISFDGNEAKHMHDAILSSITTMARVEADFISLEIYADFE